MGNLEIGLARELYISLFAPKRGAIGELGR